MGSNMDLVRIKKELLKAARGKRSQVQLSRRMGFKFNQVYRWEADLTKIHWREFVNLCEVCKVDVFKILKETLSYEGLSAEPDAFIRYLIGSQKISNIARATGISRFSISDWSKGHSDPPLDGVLKILQHLDLLWNFLEGFPGTGFDPDTSRRIRSKAAARQFFYQNPLAGAAWVCLDLSEYQKAARHIPGFISRQIGITLKEEKDILERMLEVGVVTFEGGKYKKCELNFNTRGNFEAEKKLREFWVHRGLIADQARPKMTEREHFGYLVFAADAKKRKQILEAYRQFANALTTICNNESEKDDELMAMTMQLFVPGPGAK